MGSGTLQSVENVALKAAFLLAMFVQTCNGGNILVFPVDGSHWVNMKILMEELHAKGHSMTLIRPSTSWYIPETSPLCTVITVPDEIRFDDFFDVYLKRQIEFLKGEASVLKFLSIQWEFFDMLSNAHHLLCNLLSRMIDDRELIQRLQNEKFDLVLTDPAISAGVMLAHYLKLPLVLNARWICSGEGHFAIAPSPLSYIPVPGSGNSDDMTFSQRVKNVFFYGIMLIQDMYVVRPHYKELCHKHFDEDCDVLAYTQEADIWLMRLDFVFDFPRPTMPNVVYMGGFQCKPSKALPDDLEAFVQSAGEHGFVIMSLGTLVKGLPSEMADEIAAAFAKLPQKVIWRHLGERPSTLGNNTMLVQWMPQNDLLGHSQIKAFVAHGGTNGVQEAIYHGVPVLGVPLFFDQFDNLLRVRERGGGLILDLSELNQHTFHASLQEITQNPSYRENMQRLSRLHRDQPMGPLDQAVFWIEFVMRNKGAAHLRTDSYKMPWYAYHSVDVIVTLLSLFGLLVLTTVATIRYLCCRLCCRKKIKRE
ncbi:UDP glucuronosyltransferase 5 family, polypeptide D1 [Sardina pilchardus]|uniref:UDP glucuronosyltransferase 5 family, polypeptide D1 n=1 Tax=Sardina pilchardus TaxID=27697 RepID=UPI002E157542